APSKARGKNRKAKRKVQPKPAGESASLRGRGGSPNHSLPFAFFPFTLTLDRPRSSIGQSVGLRSRRLQVRLLSGIVSGAAEICVGLPKSRKGEALPAFAASFACFESYGTGAAHA